MGRGELLEAQGARHTMRDVRKFLRDNPQVVVLLVVCLVLGIGTFVVVVISLITANPGTQTGEPSGSIWPAMDALRGLDHLRGLVAI